MSSFSKGGRRIEMNVGTQRLRFRFQVATFERLRLLRHFRRMFFEKSRRQEAPRNELDVTLSIDSLNQLQLPFPSIFYCVPCGSSNIRAINSTVRLLSLNKELLHRLPRSPARRIDSWRNFLRQGVPRRLQPLLFLVAPFKPSSTAESCLRRNELRTRKS